MRLLLPFIFIFSQTLFAQEFKFIAYYMPSKDPVDISPYTHINYSFAIPSKSGDTLLPLAQPDNAKAIIKQTHDAKKKIFISIGGWSIGDEPGDDTRFHKIAETEVGRKRFVESTMKMVNQYGFDGVDFDWEYPDEDSPSADHYVLLVSELSKALHSQNKKLTAAVVAYGKKGYGIKKEAFEYMDWLNLMAYDDDYSTTQIKAHSPYSLILKTTDYWVKERGLPAHKAVLGLPYYSKKGQGIFGLNYKKLLEAGASPFDDYFEGQYYNGLLTVKQKTQYALKNNLGGIMIWELRHDTTNEHSLGKAIREEINIFYNK